MRQLVLTVLCLSFTNLSYADICPSVSDLKNDKAKNWHAYDSDNHKPLSANRTEKLKATMARFSMAEWSQQSHKSVMHCYYTDDNGSNLEAYFAKESILSIKSSKYWYQVTGLMQCAASSEKCEFQSLPDMNQQFANNTTTIGTS